MQPINAATWKESVVDHFCQPWAHSTPQPIDYNFTTNSLICNLYLMMKAQKFTSGNLQNCKANFWMQRAYEGLNTKNDHKNPFPHVADKSANLSPVQHGGNAFVQESAENGCLNSALTLVRVNMNFLQDPEQFELWLDKTYELMSAPTYVPEEAHARDMRAFADYLQLLNSPKAKKYRQAAEKLLVLFPLKPEEPDPVLQMHRKLMQDLETAPAEQHGLLQQEFESKLHNHLASPQRNVVKEALRIAALGCAAILTLSLTALCCQLARE